MRVVHAVYVAGGRLRMRIGKDWFGVSLASVFFLIGCGGGSGAEPRTPANPPSSATSSSSNATPPSAQTGAAGKEGAWTIPNEPRDPKIDPKTPGELKLDGWNKASKTKGIAASPATCAAFVTRKATPPKDPKDVKSVLLESDVAKRDAMLVALEKTETVPGSMRVLRAELAPVECGDGIVDSFLTGKPTVSGYAGHALIGLSLAAKLSRTAANVPQLKDASDKETVKKFIQGQLRTWMVEQATAIDALSVAATELAGPGRAIGAVEAGMADLRLVDRIRSAPTPSSWDKELKAVYEAALDDALEPRKRRGRDAALVGLADFAADGVYAEPRVDRARALLAKLYGGRRIDALDQLMLVAPPKAEEKDRSIAFLSSGSRSRNAWLTSIGITPDAAPPPEQSRFEMGKKYWRRVDFVEAAHATAPNKDKPDSRLMLATALALAKGPNSAQEMMSAQSPSALNLTHTEALDALTAEGGKVAGMSAFNAAHLRSLSPPDGPDANAYLTDLVTRFKKAATLLADDPALAKRATERAADIEATSKSVAPKP
jgi:hypothetical protein